MLSNFLSLNSFEKLGPRGFNVFQVTLIAWYTIFVTVQNVPSHSSVLKKIIKIFILNSRKERYSCANMSDEFCKGI